MKLAPLAAAILALATTGCDPSGLGVVGPEGGVVVSDDGRLTLDVPEGALAEPLVITIEEAPWVPEGALGPAYRVLPVGTVFERPVEVLYDYGALGPEVDAQGVDPRLVVERDDGYGLLPDRHVIADEGVVSASALYLSTFCVVEGA